MERLDYKKIGRLIYNLRKENDLSQFKLGHILKVTDKTISKWETGEGIPDLESMYRLSKYFNKTVDELIQVGINKDILRIIMLIDKSDDLFDERHDLIEHFNRFLAQQKLIIDETRMSIFFFDSKLYTFQPTTPINDVKTLSPEFYKPSGRRSLYDSIGKVVRHYVKKSEENEKNLLIIFSSGSDNYSHNLSKESIEPILEKLKINNWDFIYVNPKNQRELGDKIYNYGEHKNIKNIFSSINEWVTSYRQSGTISLGWYNKLTRAQNQMSYCEVCGKPLSGAFALMKRHMECEYKLNQYSNERNR